MHKLRNRINTLLIPYLIWNTIAIIVLIAYNYFLKYVFPYAAQDIHFSFTNILNCYGYYNHLLVNETPIYSVCPINSPLWFLRNLIIIVLCSPIVYKLLNKSERVILLLGVCWMVLKQWHQESIFCDVFYQFTLAFFFFSWGGDYSIYNIDLSKVFTKHFRLSIFLYIIIGLLSIASIYVCPQLTLTIKGLNMVIGVVFAFNILYWLACKRNCRANTTLASAGFFIYVAHMIFERPVETLVSGIIHPHTEFMQIIASILLIPTLIGLLLGCFYLMRRYTPKLLSVLIGRK